ncbi:MAG: hypothetical protein ACOC9D_03125 [Thermodesulfobacteriota bacterium]
MVMCLERPIRGNEIAKDHFVACHLARQAGSAAGKDTVKVHGSGFTLEDRKIK